MLTIFHYKKIRLHILCGLVFSVFICCSSNDKEEGSIIIQWKNNRAEAIIIPPGMLVGVDHDSVKQLVRIKLNSLAASILGEFSFKDDSLVFRPLIAFTHGLKYDVYIAGKAVTQFEIPKTVSAAPDVTAVYPTVDTVPQNLLKFYVEFSKPMQSGDALENIVVLKNGHDTVPVFLDMELWNNDRTMLTLWLDPGRIKRDLQPNLKMGPPLIQGVRYSLVIKNSLRDADGMSMKDTYHKDFIVGIKDTLLPDPRFWTVVPPKAGTNLPLKIYLHESLDHTLLKNALFIVDKNDGHTMDGTFETDPGERVLNFTPAVKWNKGDYAIGLESRLEDLAGNNLDRLFERDINQQEKKDTNKVNKIPFRVQ